jgi:hypothetical protein
MTSNRVPHESDAWGLGGRQRLERGAAGERGTLSQAGAATGADGAGRVTTVRSSMSESAAYVAPAAQPNVRSMQVVPRSLLADFRQSALQVRTTATSLMEPVRLRPVGCAASCFTPSRRVRLGAMTLGSACSACCGIRPSRSASRVSALACARAFSLLKSSNSAAPRPSHWEGCPARRSANSSARTSALVLVSVKLRTSPRSRESVPSPYICATEMPADHSAIAAVVVVRRCLMLFTMSSWFNVWERFRGRRSFRGDSSVESMALLSATHPLLSDHTDYKSVMQQEPHLKVHSRAR